MLNVLYVCVDWYRLDGSSASLLNMLSGLGGRVHPIVLISQEGVVSERFRESGCEVIVSRFFLLYQRPWPIWSIIHRPSRIRLWRYWQDDKRCVDDVCRQLFDRHIDIVHSNSSAATVGAGIAKRLGAKHVWHVREFLDKDFGVNAFLGKKRLRSMIDKADARICISKAIASHWHFLSDTKVIYNAVRKKSQAVYCKEKENYFLFCAAGVTELKGASFAVRSFGLSGIWKKGYSLVMAGQCEPRYKAHLIELAKAYGVSDQNLLFPGTQTDMCPLFSKATAFLMCSPSEALGRVTVEAMFYGCLVLGRNGGATPEIVSDGHTGYIFDTEEECAYLMQKACHYEDAQMIQRAMQYAVQTFSEEDYALKIMKVYECL